jgi:beta-glucanase (GH16 family)
MHKNKLFGPALIVANALILILLLSCRKTSDPLPELKIGNASLTIGTIETTMKFQLTLNKVSTVSVSVDYALIDGTAVSPADFGSSAGTVTIPENQKDATIDVVIKGDPLKVRRPNIQFTVNLSNPKSCTLTGSQATGTIITQDGTYLLTDNTGYSTPLTYPGYTLVWSDEFSGNSLDLNVWNQEGGNSGGWGNNELEYYTSSQGNTFVSNGNLIIEARREAIGGFNYSSGRMTTQDKKAFKFGRIDIRAKLPVGNGIWPALWMLGSDINSVGWPACGETDIMELIGKTPSTVYGTMHWANGGGTHSSKGAEFELPAGDYSKEFHVFSIIWTLNNISWYVDDQKYLETSVADTGDGNYPFNADQYFIFNVAVGGNWPGSPDSNTLFPQRMFVDYVRVFQ